MKIQQRLKQQQDIELQIWLAPVPSLNKLKVMTATGTEDLGTGNTFGTDGSTLPDLGDLSPLGSWNSVAAVIQRKAQQLAKFDPTITEFNDLTWSTYISTLLTAPFWLSTSQTVLSGVRISPLSLSSAIDAVSDLIEAVATQQTFNTVVTSIKKIATIAMNNEGAEQKDNFQQQGLISVKSSTMSVGFLRTSVQMTYKKGKGYEQLNQNLDIQQGYGILDFDKCKRSYETILSWDSSDVDEWEKDSNSVNAIPNDSPAWNN